MCVIVYKPKGIKLERKVIADCFIENPNGAGYTVIYEKNNFVTRKGFMTENELDASLEENGGDFTPYDMILHFRISTSGGINPINCHPYPISHKQSDFTVTESINQPVIYHNGVLFGIKQSWSNDIELYSDTFLLARDILSRTDATGITNVLSLIANTSNNKFAHVDKHGTVTLYGDFKKHNDVFYSNMLWNEPITKFTWGEWNRNQWDNTSTSTRYTGTKCKKCGTFLFTWERYDNGLCLECSDENKLPVKKNKENAIVGYDVRACLSCGVVLVKHEIGYCDDCLEWITNPRYGG